MPINKYFAGHGKKVMKAMKSQYGEAKGERVFYAKANEMKAKDHMPTGAGMSPSGDIAAHRGKEVRAAFPRPIKSAGSRPDVSAQLPYRKPEVAGGGDRVC